MIFLVDNWNNSYLAYQSKQTLFCLLHTPTVKVRGNFPSLNAYVFQNRGSPCNYRVREDEKKLRLFGLMYKGGCLWLFVGSLWSLDGSL